MRARPNHCRPRWAWAATLLAVAMLLTGGLAATAQQAEPAAGYRAYLPLVTVPGAPPNEAPAVRFPTDAARAASAAIGPAGGTLTATGADGTRYDLLIPPDALDFTELITMTPVLRAENLPLSGGMIGAVSLEPAGLDLYAPAILRVLSPTAAPDLLTVGFTYDGEGAQFHLRPIVQPEGVAEPQVAEPVAISMEIISIRPVGVALAARADLEHRKLQPDPADPIDAMEDDLVAEALELIEREVERRVYVNHVLPLLERAVTDTSVVDQAIRAFDRWLHVVDTNGDRTHFITQLAEGKRLIGQIIPRASAAAADRCYSQKRPEEGFRLLRWMRYARTYLGSAEVAAIQAKLAKCLRFELTFHSHMTEGGFGDPYGYRYQLQAMVVLRGSTGMSATGAGPLEWLEAVWIGRASACDISVAGVGSTFDAQQPGFGLSITPVSRTSPAVNITLRYHPGTPGEHTTIACPGGGGVSASTQAWATYFGQTHAHEREGAGYRVTAQVVGAGSFPGWMYTHLTTSGPSGQAVIEDTRIELVHAPEQ